MIKLEYTNLYTIIHNSGDLVFSGYNNNVIYTQNDSIIEQFETQEEMNTRLTELNFI